MPQRTHGGNDHHNVRLEATDATDHVHELLHAEVGSKASLGNQVLTELEANAIGNDRVVAVGDVGERSTVHQAELTFERLHDVRLDRVAQEDGHRAGGLDVLGGNRIASLGVANRDRAKLAAQVRHVGGERHDGHHFTRCGDVEAGLGWDAILGTTKAGHDVAQRAVRHIDRAPPGDVRDLRAVAVEDVCVDKCRQQIVGSSDGVDVTREVQVEVLHRYDLGPATASRTTLDTEDGAKRRLTQRQHCATTNLAHALRQRDRRCRLALTSRRRRDCRDIDDLAVRAIFQAIEDRKLDLRLVATEEFELIWLDAVLGSNVCDWAEHVLLGNFKARLHRFDRLLGGVTTRELQGN